MGVLNSLTSLLVSATGLMAQALGEAPPPTALEALLATPVTLATKGKLRPEIAPAVISVVTRHEILLSGARSVGEALERVPGLYAVDDGLALNVGVRGVNGGLRAYGRILKVLLDGQSVAFRSDSANFLGPELVPIQAVDHIEIIRGPGSALYGADAFYGVVNIVTRSDSSHGSAEVRGSRAGTRNGLGAEFMAPAGDSSLGGFLSASENRLDRSGRPMPDSSPLLKSTGVDSTVSTGEIARPLSAYGRAWWQVLPDMRIELNGSFRRLDTGAEWLDFGTLSHQNRVALDQSSLRLGLQAALSANLDLSGAVAWSEGGPSHLERLNTGSTEDFPRRSFGFTAWDADLELKWRAPWGGTVLGGVDALHDRELLPTIYTVVAASGAQLLSSPLQGHWTASNLGAYLQLEQDLGRGWHLTANIRRDAPSRYDASATMRGALVWAPGGPWSAKLLYGTSFKAPDPMSLHSEPLYAGDLLGNPDLKPERARTWEAEGRWRISNEWAVNFSAFRSQVADKVIALPFLNNRRPENVASTAGSGAEMELRGFLGFHRFTFSGAWQRTEDRRTDPFLGDLTAPSPFYPEWVIQAGWRFQDQPWGDLDLWGRYVSPRRASLGNIRWNYQVPYALDGYMTFNATWTLTLDAQRFQIFCRNLGGRRYAESGFNGYDVPGQPREWGLSYARFF